MWIEMDDIVHREGKKSDGSLVEYRSKLQLSSCGSFIRRTFDAPLTSTYHEHPPGPDFWYARVVLQDGKWRRTPWHRSLEEAVESPMAPMPNKISKSMSSQLFTLMLEMSLGLRDATHEE
jgi:hypothetical protein